MVSTLSSTCPELSQEYIPPQEIPFWSIELLLNTVFPFQQISFLIGTLSA